VSGSPRVGRSLVAERLRGAVHREFEKRILDIAEAGSLPRRLVRASINVAVGEIAGLALSRIPLAGGTVGLAISAADETRAWLSRRLVGAHQATRAITLGRGHHASYPAKPGPP
jgi:hypothetical protein